jgi:hypothetical protein
MTWSNAEPVTLNVGESIVVRFVNEDGTERQWIVTITDRVSVITDDGAVATYTDR